MVRTQVSGSKLLITSMSTKVDKDITAPKKKTPELCTITSDSQGQEIFLFYSDVKCP